MSDSFLEVSDLKEVLEYDSASGKLTWKSRNPEQFSQGAYCPQRRAARWNARYAGTHAGCDNGKGYLVLRYQGRSLKAHRVAFAMAFGRWPKAAIDHINGDRSDNRKENLREVNSVQNNRNSSLRWDNTSGTCGVSEKSEGKWRAYLGEAGRQIHLGTFSTRDRAIRAVSEARKNLGYHENHGRKT